MIQRLYSLDACADFIGELNRDAHFSDPMLSTEDQLENNLLKSVNKPNDHVLGVYDGDVMTGLFDFLILEEERYMEMIVGLSRSARAYEEIAAHLQANYPGYQADFVFNPKNGLLSALLHRLGASFDLEQQKMVFAGPLPEIDLAGIEPLSERYLDQYVAMHPTDVYWTAPKVARTPDRFNVFLAVDGGEVVGYIDVTNRFEENEFFDLRVKEDRRRRGWGRKLTVKALEANRPKGMMLLTEVSNAPAIALYESVGFRTVPGQNSVTATWIID